MLIGPARSGSLSAKALRFDDRKPLNVVATANKYEAMLTKYKAAKENSLRRDTSTSDHFEKHSDRTSGALALIKEQAEALRAMKERADLQELYN